jgi:aspartate-semialdehyde dehydrogenase
VAYKVALVGATGAVGSEFIRTLEERKFPVSEIHFFASERSAGKRLHFNGAEVTVKELTPDCFKGIEIAFFATESPVSKQWAPVAAKAGAAVCDDSSAFRMEPAVPLVVAEVNPEDIKWHKGIISNPNCSTIGLLVAINPLHKVNPIKRIIVSTYQAVSGWGQAANEELDAQVKQYAKGEKLSYKIFPHQIAFNVLPEIDSPTENGYTKEEWKMAEETHKILHDPSIRFTATCARVPVFVGHSEAATLEFTRPMSPKEAKDILSKAPGVVVMDNLPAHVYPDALTATGRDETFVGRIREDTSNPGGLVMWLVSDNTRKGSATNTIQIAEEMIKRGWLTGQGR